MKAVKINMSENSTSKSVKALIVGSVLNALLIVITTIVISLFLVVSGNLFESISGYLMLVPLAVGGYFGGYTSARINKSNGLLFGILSGSIVFLFMLIVSFCISDATVTYMLLLKAIAVILPAAIGGVKGVNKKEKLKI